MSIVVVTIPGPAKQKFVADLQAATGNAVSLVVVQTRPVPSWHKRMRGWRALSWQEIISRLYYGLRLRVQPSLRAQLCVFQATRAPEPETDEWAAPVHYTENVNSDAVFAKIKSHNPVVLAVWGSGMLDQRLVRLPIYALNLHFGISAAYRGAYANQRAVEKADWEAIGTTIHYLNGRADSGAVLTTTNLPWLETPYASFSALHDRTVAVYIEHITDLLQGQSVSTTTPDLTQSENLRLRDWTPQRRFRVAQILKQWQQKRQAPR